MKSTKELDEFLDVCSLPKSNSDETFSTESYKIFKEELIPILFKLFHKIEMEGVLSNYFYKASSILIVRPTKDLTQMGNYRPSFPVGIHAKICTKIIVFQSTSKELFIMINRDFIPGI